MLDVTAGIIHGLSSPMYECGWWCLHLIIVIFVVIIIVMTSVMASVIVMVSSELCRASALELGRSRKMTGENASLAGRGG